jgi:alpha/beta superfamily hydrolase
MNSVGSKKTNTFFRSLITSAMLILFSINVHGYAPEYVTKNGVESEPKLVQIKARANDDFLLFADYYSGDKRSGGVIVLHDCNSDRSSYSTLAKNLAQQGLHTLLVDLRGYGDSISRAYSLVEIKKKAIDIVSYQSEMASVTANWPDDLLSTFQFLAKTIDKSKGIAVIASGCSGAYAVSLAEKIQLNSIVMITPKMTYSDKERYKNLTDIPSYFITSSNHQDSYETTQELFSWSGDKGSKLQVFKGTTHDYQLISRKKHLINDIALWVKSNLSW